MWGSMPVSADLEVDALLQGGAYLCVFGSLIIAASTSADNPKKRTWLLDKLGPGPDQ